MGLRGDVILENFGMQKKFTKTHVARSAGNVGLLRKRVWDISTNLLLLGMQILTKYRGIRELLRGI